MGRPSLINRAEVLAAALAVADEHGLDAITMQTVAWRLGVTPMALYRHVRNKDDLLDGLVEAVLHEFPVPDETMPWPDRLGQLATGIRAAAHRHPHVFPLLLRGRAQLPQARRARQSVYPALRAAGLPPSQIPRAERLLSSAILGFAASEAAGRFAHHPRAVRDADFAFLLDTMADVIGRAANVPVRDAGFG